MGAVEGAYPVTSKVTAVDHPTKEGITWFVANYYLPLACASNAYDFSSGAVEDFMWFWATSSHWVMVLSSLH